MLFNLKTADIRTLEIDGTHYIAVDTNWMGTPMRLGDLTMTSCLLLCLKQQLITQHPTKFNRHNLYFILNRCGGLMVNDVRLCLSLFPNIWKDIDTNCPDWYNVRNLVSGGNVWSFKWYLERQGMRLNDVANDMHVIDPSNLCIPSNKRNQIYLFPVRKKEYNIERNMDDDVLIDIIRKVDAPVTMITKDISSGFDKLLRADLKHPVRMVNKGSWINIILNIIRDCKLFISGDCGLTHLVSMIHEDYKPAMDIYYRTKPYSIKKALNQFDKEAKLRRNQAPINFKPWSPYLTDDINTRIRTF